MRLDPVHLRREIGYVIQQVGLFPHMTVEENITVVLRLLEWDARRRRARAEELLELVGLPPDFLSRYPRQLSGGQQQRVGVARALAADPDIILMDEPFGAVDPIIRRQLQLELKRIQAAVRKTILFVTHDLSEAFLLGDHIVVMNEGRIVQDGTPQDLLLRPANEFVARFIAESRALGILRVRKVSEVMDPALTKPSVADCKFWVRSEDSLFDAIRRLGSQLAGVLCGLEERTVAVLDESGSVVGCTTFEELVRAVSEAFATSGVPEVIL
jgi:osmoprotectant transport system ATP-binding protein